MQVFANFLWNFIFDEILFITKQSENDLKLFKEASDKVWRIFIECACKLDPKDKMTTVFWASVGYPYSDYDELASILNEKASQEEGEYTRINVSNSLNDVKAAIFRCMRDNYFDKLYTNKNIKKHKPALLGALHESMKPHEIVASLYVDAVKGNKSENAWALMKIVLLLISENINDKNSLVLFCKIKIDKFINKKQYNEAVGMFNLAIEIDPLFKFELIANKVYSLIINKTVIRLIKSWDFINKETKITIERIIKGIGDLSCSENIPTLSMVRGGFNESYRGIPIQQAIYEVDEIYVNIYTTRDSVIIQSDFDFESKLKDEEQHDVIGNEQLGQMTYHI